MLQTVGLYRINGDMAAVQKLRSVDKFVEKHLKVCLGCPVGASWPGSVFLKFWIHFVKIKPQQSFHIIKKFLQFYNATSDSFNSS